MSDTVTVNAKELADQRRLLDLIGRAWTDPEIGSQLRRKVKEYDPSVSIPDDNPVAVEAMKRVQAAEDSAAATAKALEDYKAGAASERAERDLRRKLGDIQTKRGLTDEGMAGMIELMQTRQIADPDAAAALYVESLPKPKPVAATNPLFDTKADMFGTTKIDEKWEKLHLDPDGFFADVVNDVFSEMPVQG